MVFMDPYQINLKQQYQKVEKLNQLPAWPQQLLNTHSKVLDYITLKPSWILCADLFSSLFYKSLEKSYKPKKIIAQHLALKHLAKFKKQKSWFSKLSCIQTSNTSLPYLANSFDLIISHLSLHEYTDIQSVLAEWRRILKPNGILLLNTLGPDTLKEVRLAGILVDHHVHVNRFIDPQLLSEALLKAGFADPIIDITRYNLQYASIPALLQDVKQNNFGNFALGRNHFLSGKSWKEKFIQALKKEAYDGETFKLSLEVVSAHAFAAEPNTKSTNNKGEYQIPVSKIKKML